MTLRPCDLDLLNDLDLYSDFDLDFSHYPESTFSPQLALESGGCHFAAEPMGHMPLPLL